MKKIGLLSDTHGHLDPKIFLHFKDVDEIWHAGDIGTIEVLDELNKFKPTRAVYGNIDGADLRTECKEFETFNCEDVNVMITHIGGKPGYYYPQTKLALEKKVPDLFICGHSHICLVKMDSNYDMLWMNPGACGYKGFHQIKTILRFNISGTKIQNLEVIELGKRV